MGKVEILGAFEELVLLAVVHTKDDGYGMTIRRELEGRTGRPVSIGAVYATLDRLEVKGYVRSRTGETSTARRGRARRYFRLTREGARALEGSREITARMWRGVRLDGAWR